ncbi:MAG TPA: glucosyl-3-phosphoglycerate synthase [Acidimicrobiales bacterium]|nr:glucosyl-3-phosphoglycerate synthase [Acidimicrobiales bacterium]
MIGSEIPWTLAREPFSLERVAELKGDVTVSVIIPARNEAATVGAVLDTVQIHDEFIDELVVVDDHSSDDTATVADHHGARVVHLEGVGGKGAAMGLGLAASTSTIVVFLDADVLNTAADYVARLLQPLLERPTIQLVKGFYERPLHDMPTGGGRVNELAARPILSLLYPGLGEIRQPLAGETALRRAALDTILLEPNYSVEIALLIDVAQLFGVRSLAQVDLGVRRHRNRPLDELRPMAVDVLRAALERYKVDLPSQS